MRDARDRVDDLLHPDRARDRDQRCADEPAGKQPGVAGTWKSRTILLVALVAAMVLTAVVVVTKPWAASNPSTPAATPTCEDIGVMARRDDTHWVKPFRDAYQRAGGRDELGCPVANNDGFVHSWAPGLSQDLYGGRSVNARIMALDENRVVVMPGRYWRDYTRTFGARTALQLGYPTGDPLTCGPAKIVRLDGGTHSPGALVTAPDGTFIWLRRAAWSLYQQLGGPQGPLGRPRTTLGDQLDGTIPFEHGFIHLTGEDARAEPAIGPPLTPIRC
jgi:hypothetical protein